MSFNCLSIAGHTVVNTPNLDTIARETVRFKNEYSPYLSYVAARAY